MNLQHLKYIIEVERTHSISKAAENLFMAQPNLSKAIKELEENINLTIFKRSSKGVVLTDKGIEFITFAKNILNQVESVEKMYKHSFNETQSLSISVPRASYISDAFTKFVKTLDNNNKIAINYKETNAMKTINNISDNNFNLGIVRYQVMYDKYFQILFREKELTSQDICSFKYLVLFSANHKLAKQEIINKDDLSDFIEITHGDPYVPMLPTVDVQKSEFSQKIDKRIFIYERGSQFDLLNEVNTTFMRVSPIPSRIIERYNLVQKKCVAFDSVYKDVLINNKFYRFSQMDKDLVKEIKIAAKLF